jgi:hypothetical protein
MMDFNVWTFAAIFVVCTLIWNMYEKHEDTQLKIEKAKAEIILEKEKTLQLQSSSENILKSLESGKNTKNYKQE